MSEILVKDIPPLTIGEIQQIEALKDRDIVFDEESPESTPAMFKAFGLASINRDRKLQ